jgi:outer membrane protein assembly factor BamB
MTHGTPTAATILGVRQAIFFTQKGLVSVIPTTGKVLWRYEFPYNVSTAITPVVCGDIVFCSAGYHHTAGAAKLAKNGDAWTATEIWRQKGSGKINHWSTPVYKDGYLYGMFGFKEYGTCPIKCFDVATGEEKWSKPGFGPGNVILAGDKLLALSDAGDLVLIDPNAKEYKELARMKAVAGKCWGTPSIAENRIYVRSSKEGACFELPKSVAAK